MSIPLDYQHGAETPLWKRILPDRRSLPLTTAIVVFAAMYISACIRYRDNYFFTLDTFLGFFRDEGILGIAALGSTLVILSGGIDLSVGSIVGFTTVLIAQIVAHATDHPYLCHPLVAWGLALAIGTLAGAIMGSLIQFFSLAPFLVTLGGLYCFHGFALLITDEEIAIDHPFYDWILDPDRALPLSHGHQLHQIAVIFIVMTLLLIFISRHTAFGRNIFAIGGSEPSAVLMGLPVVRTKIAVYAMAGFFSALAGIAFTFNTPKGSPMVGDGMELQAIAAVVIGGTLLTGGIGYVIGTPIGVLVIGLIQTALNNEQGGLSSWWLSIATGALLLMFLIIQQLMQLRHRARHAA